MPVFGTWQQVSEADVLCCPPLQRFHSLPSPWTPKSKMEIRHHRLQFSIPHGARAQADRARGRADAMGGNVSASYVRVHETLIFRPHANSSWALGGTWPECTETSASQTFTHYLLFRANVSNQGCRTISQMFSHMTLKQCTVNIIDSVLVFTIDPK